MTLLTEPTRIVLRKDSVAATDTNIREVSLLLHGNQSGGEFVDSSLNPKVITRVGGVAPGSPGGGTPVYPSSNSAFGSAIEFDKVDDRLTLAASSDFAFGTGDFTIEFWAYSRDVLGATQRGFLQISSVTGGLNTSFANSIVIVQGSNAGGSALNGGLAAIVNNNFVGSDTSVLSINTWFHVALTRASGAVRLFFNGNVHASITNTSNLTGSNLAIGGYYDTTVLYDGYIDDLRVTKGVARYTANFTPPTAPFPDF